MNLFSNLKLVRNLFVVKTCAHATQIENKANLFLLPN